MCCCFPGPNGRIVRKGIRAGRQGSSARHRRFARSGRKGSDVRFLGNASISTERLHLEPLSRDDAEEMAGVLSDVRLHEFIGGHPATVEELRVRYQKLIAGSSRPEEAWLNWIVRRRSDGQAVGTTQATVIDHDGAPTAHVAWVIGVPWQYAGFASEAAKALVAWLREQGVVDIVAHVHPDHLASARVAERAGLSATDDYVDGERVWRSVDPNIARARRTERKRS
jgi:RimJ/RimL family protein N-acetyltransferase